MPEEFGILLLTLFLGAYSVFLAGECLGLWHLRPGHSRPEAITRAAGPLPTPNLARLLNQVLGAPPAGRPF